MAETHLVFLPWLRRGMAASITRPDQAGGPVQPVTTFAVTATTDGGTAKVDLPLVGPGDIAGLDTRVISRTRPGRDESDAEFNHFVSIEFDQADLPWRYTPATQNASGHLTPWLTLLVLADGEFEAVTPSPAQKLASAKITNMQALPPLADAWAWGHVQLHGAAETATTPLALAEVLKGQPGLFVARLLSTRVLVPQTRYTAMLVPSYARGVFAGLGQAVPAIDALTPAWTGSESSVTLPIYFQWQFQTGVVGDFASLARSLKPAPIDKTVGRRDLDVSVPGFDLKNAAVTPVEVPPKPTVTAMPMEGALQSFQASQLGEPSISPLWQSGIESFVNTNTTSVNNVVQPLVSPPMYGRWHAPETALNAGSRPWFGTLNRDPRHRTSAGLGTLVVESRHQELLASAWSQVEGLLEANSQRKFLQLGREAFKRTFLRHIQSGSADSALLTLGGLHRWVLNALTGNTLHAEVGSTNVGRPLFGAQWRRFARPRGPVGRRQLRHLPGKAPLTPVSTIAGGFEIAPAPPPAPSGAITQAAIFAGLVLGSLTPAEVAIIATRTTDTMVFWGILLFCSARKLLAAGAGSSWPWLLRILRFAIGLLRLAGGSTGTVVSGGLRDGTLAAGQVTGAPGNAAFQLAINMPATIPAPPTPGGADHADAAAFRLAYANMLGAFANAGLPRPVPPALNVSATLTALLTGLSPEVTLAAGPLARLTIDSSIFWSPADKLEPVQAAPTFPQPMWAALRDESADWILPGLDKVPTNSVGLVVSNQRFIEAYMVGLNHEMARTLLWNGYPTDQRGTYFKQFWDSRVTAGTTGPLTDIAPLTSWASTELGTHSPRTTPPAAVLLVRGELIRRYPNVVVYAVTDAASTDPVAPQKTPVFSGRLTSDVSFYGFTFPKEDVVGGPKYAFVLQEQPAEPRFAVTVDPPPDLYFKPSTAPATTAAEFAVKTCQRPTRVVIPGTLLVPQT